MEIMRAYKTELRPNNKQSSFFGRCCGASRYVYNWGLAEWQRQYEAGEKPSVYSLKKQFNAQKDEICPWIRMLPYKITESAFANLGAAFENYFRRLKNGEKEPGYPNFKKKGKESSFQLGTPNIAPDRVKVTGLGWVRLKEQNYIPVDAKKYGVYSTISEKTSRWYISVLVYETMEPSDCLEGVLGVDVGIKSLAVCSNGLVIDNPKALDDAQRKINRLNRELARRKRGGSNYKKTKEKLSKAHAKAAAVRKHTLHNASRRIVDSNAALIGIEDLNVKGMQKNHRIARALGDASMSELHRLLDYKAQWNGAKVVKIGRFAPTSKVCSRCGWVKGDLKLSERTFKCDQCGFEMDRDLNAAINIAVLAKAEAQPDCLGS